MLTKRVSTFCQRYMSILYAAVFLLILANASSDNEACSKTSHWFVGNAKYVPVLSGNERYIYTFCKWKGFSAGDHAIIRCADGKLEKPLTQCQKVVDGCSPLSNPAHGSKNCDEGAPAKGTSCRFRCQKTHYLKGSNERKCGTNLQWTGSTPWCTRRAECPVPPPLVNGTVIGCSIRNKPFFEDSCSFRCNEGFELLGASKLVCNDRGRLTDGRGVEGYPRCVAKNRHLSIASSVPETKLYTRDEYHGIPHSASRFCDLGNGGCDHDCHEENGFVRCTCRQGFTLREDGRKCEAKKYPLLVAISVPRTKPNIRGEYHGISHSARFCDAENGECDHECHEDNGFVRCTCRQGFTLREDGRTCEDIDECVSLIHHCQHNCINTNGGYKCSCRPDYRLIDNFHCEALQETGSSLLYPYGEPRRISGSTESKGKTRKTNHPSVPETEKSVVSRNSQRFISPSERKGKTRESTRPAHRETKSSVVNSGPRKIPGTIAQKGKTHQSTRPIRHETESSVINNRQFPDTTERNGGKHLPSHPSSCLSGNGGCSQICETKESATTCQCYEGFELAADRKTCNDIDECATANFGCSHLCVNAQGGAHCGCPEGFKLLEDRKTCKDIDECSNTSLNRCDHKCHNTEGSYACSCYPGYILFNEFQCQGCRMNSYRSSRDASCVECPPNSYTKSEAQTSIAACHCLPGFSGDLSKSIPCEDINECSAENFGCSHGCVNTPGSAFCFCSPGFELQEDQKTCKDIDECSIKNGGCEGLCHNTDGDFFCTCPKGYSVSETDRYSCSDVDECQEKNGGCSDLCVNFLGGHYCLCPEHYHLDTEGKNCIAARCPKIGIPHHSTVRCFPKDNNANKTIFKTGNMSESTEFPIGTQCRLKCNKGYEMGKSLQTIECQNDGKWNTTLPDCEVLQCPPLKAPEHGDVHPRDCLIGFMTVKTKCYFTCHPGYRLIGQQIVSCKNNLTWNAKELPTCVPNSPFISCPDDVSVYLTSNESFVSITLPAPVTNMEQFQVKPEWVNVDETTAFPAGKTEVTFSAITFKNKTIRCRMSVTVSDLVPPVFNDCPDSFEVDGGNIYGIQVYWDEPIATDNVGIESTLKSLEPNSTLTPGVHIAEYVAKDIAGNVAKCSFEISVISADCSDLADPENGEANCMDLMFGKICEPTCYTNFTRSPSETSIFVCDDSGTWLPSDVISPCLQYDVLI